jgi:hypothetical protein
MEREDITFRLACENLVVPSPKPKKEFNCVRCGQNCCSKDRFKTHMLSRNCKRVRLDVDDPEPHETIGNNLKICLDQFQSSKEKNHSDERIM